MKSLEKPLKFFHSIIKLRITQLCRENIVLREKEENNVLLFKWETP